MAEAEAYLRHPILGSRLVECCEAVVGVDDRSAHEIFGSPDDMKLRSRATLFARVSDPGSVFERLLLKYFLGVPDERTLELVGGEAGGSRARGAPHPPTTRPRVAAGVEVGVYARSAPQKYLQNNR